ncbi:MAG: hypothetical protein AAGH89_07905 [Verrucomicrobiota bacterium]
MPVDPHNTLPLRQTPERGYSTRRIAKQWFGIAAFWFVAQFLTSEALYRASDRVYSYNEMVGDWMTEASNFVAWPAGRFYDLKLFEQVEREYNRAISDPNLTAATKTKLEKLHDDHNGNFENYDFHYEVADLLRANPNYPDIDYLSAPVEYAIYLGVCLAWAITVGITGFVCTLAYRSGLEE